MSDSDLAQKFTALQARLDKLIEAPEPEPPAEPIDPERQFAAQLAASLAQAQSKWWTA